MSKPELTISIPTYNEAKNIGAMAERVFAALKSGWIHGEILVIDDSSPDGTADLAAELSAKYPIRVYVRKQRLGPGPAIMDGIRLAEAPIVCIMDGDLSHPPEVLPEMFKMIKSGKANLVIGSRHVSGGGTSDWIWYRKFFSWGARMLGRMLTPVSHLTSGFFMFDKKILEGTRISPIGCKVGLELMVKGNHQGKVAEYPIVFAERAAGESKMGSRETIQYIQHLLALNFYKLGKALRLNK